MLYTFERRFNGDESQVQAPAASSGTGVPSAVHHPPHDIDLALVTDTYNQLLQVPLRKLSSLCCMTLTWPYLWICNTAITGTATKSVLCLYAKSYLDKHGAKIRLQSLEQA